MNYSKKFKKIKIRINISTPYKTIYLSFLLFLLKSNNLYSTPNGIKNIDGADKIKKTSKYNGFIIKKIYIVSLPYFNSENSTLKLINKIKNYTNIIPKTKKKIIFSTITLKEGQKFNSISLLKSWQKLNSLTSIKNAYFEIEEQENNKLEIYIYSKDNFPIMVNPFTSSIKYKNIFGTNIDFKGGLVPRNNFWDVYLKKISGYYIRLNALNICGSSIDMSINYTDKGETNLSELNLKRSLDYDNYLIGSFTLGGKREKINLYNYNKNIVSEDYFRSNYFKTWVGYSFNFTEMKEFDEKQNNFKLKLVPNFGYEYENYLELTKNLFVDGYTNKQNLHSIGIGIGLLRSSNLKYRSIYDRNNIEIYTLGQKFYISSGYLFKPILDQPYFTIEFSNGNFLKKIGYFSIDIVCTFLQGGNLKNISVNSSKSTDTDVSLLFNFISKRIGNDKWSTYQIFKIKNLNRFGDSKKNYTDLGGIENLNSFKGINDTIDHKISLMTESLLLTPLKLYILRMDYFIFLESLHFFNYSQKRFVNNLAFGGGILLSVIGMGFKIGFGYVPTLAKELGDKSLSKLVINFSLSPTVDIADININNPFYKSLN